MKDDVLNGHLVYFVSIWYGLWSFGRFFLVLVTEPNNPYQIRLKTKVGTLYPRASWAGFVLYFSEENNSFKN
jgi:hypothetical protein